MKDTPTPRTDARQKLKDIIGDEYVAVDFACQLERELTEANEYADKLAAGLPDGMLPKDVGVLREANLELAVELTAVTEQRDRMAEALQKVVTSWDEATWLDENEFESFREALQSLNPPNNA